MSDIDNLNEGVKRIEYLDNITISKGKAISPVKRLIEKHKKLMNNLKDRTTCTVLFYSL